MIRKLITTDDFVTTKQTYTRFGEKVECKPIVTYFRAGLLKDYKNLNTDAEVLFFDGREVANDAGQGMYRKVYTKHTEDIGVYIKIGNHFYKRQYTGAVNLGWFGDDTNAIRTALKYGFIRFEQKTYNLDYDVYSLTNNVKIDLNGATIIIKGTPIYGFFFRVNDYILKIMNGTIKAHSSITNIARISNASAITTDFRTNIKFLDLEGNQLDLHQLPNTNEILYRGVNSRLDINGRKHFTSTDGLRTLRIKEGIAAPTDDNQLVPATYESEEFDYSNLVKSNVNTTINGVKIFTDFVYNVNCISIYDAPVTTTAIEYYLQVFKTQIETQMINLFIINNYFKLNAYYISCDIYKEVDSTITIDEDNTSNINLLFNARFVTFKNANNYSEFNTYKYKWKINKRTYSKDNYTIKAHYFIDDFNILCATNILVDEPVNISFGVTYAYYTVSGKYNPVFTDHYVYTAARIIDTIIVDGYLAYVIALNSKHSSIFKITTLHCYIQGKTVNIPSILFEFNSILRQDILINMGDEYGFKLYNKFNNKYANYFGIISNRNVNNWNQHPYVKLIYYSMMNLENMYIKLKSDAFSNVNTQYMDIVNSSLGYKLQGDFITDNLVSYTFVDCIYNNKTYSVITRYVSEAFALTSDYYISICVNRNNKTFMYIPPKSIFIGNVTTGEASLEEPILDNPILYNKRHKFIKMTIYDRIGVAFLYNKTDNNYAISMDGSRYCSHNLSVFNPDIILQYFDVILLPTDKTLDDYSMAELDNMIINPT